MKFVSETAEREEEEEEEDDEQSSSSDSGRLAEGVVKPREQISLQNDDGSGEEKSHESEQTDSDSENEDGELVKQRAPKKLILKEHQTAARRSRDNNPEESNGSDSESGDVQGNERQAGRLQEKLTSDEQHLQKEKKQVHLTQKQEDTGMLPPARRKPDEESGYSLPSGSGFIVTSGTKLRRSETNMTPIARKFSNEDEISLLEGLGAFWAKGRNNQWAQFHRFIKDDLTQHFTKVQVSEKIRGLKKKFERNFRRARAQSTGGRRLDFEVPHDSVVYELSKKLWGDDEEAENPISGEGRGKRVSRRTRKGASENKSDEEDEPPRKRGKPVVGYEFSKQEFEPDFPLLRASFGTDFVRGKCIVMGGKEAQELEDKLRELTVLQLEVELKRVELEKRDLKRRLHSM